MDNVMTENSRGFETTAFQLRIIAIFAMIMDHAYKIAGIGGEFMTIIGRLAFPIFAFQIAEGYVHTKDFKSYLKKMLFFAIISEIPFNLVAPLGGIFDPLHQNVLWTFLIGLIILRIIDIIRNNTKNSILMAIQVVLVSMIGYFVGNIAAVDYSGIGVLTVVIFYLTRNCRYKYIMQLVAFAVLNSLLLGHSIPVNIFGLMVAIPIQLFALFALIPIWLYKGKQGYHSKNWSRFCYWFYPVHIIVLFLVTYFGHSFF